MASIKKNFAWSSILTTAGYVFPLLTFPYITRVLGVENIGSTNFSTSVISYFSVFAMMGISFIGVREIAKAKKDKEELSKVFGSLLFLNLFTTLIAITVLLYLINIIPSFKSHEKLLYIGVGQLLCGSLLIEWLYKGLEDFRFITMRSIAIRFFYVIAVFAFVRKPSDYVLYYTLTILTTVLNSFINFVYARRFVSFKLNYSYIKKYIKPYFIYGIYMILTSMYGSFNTVYLGARCGDIEVGYYSTAIKLYTIIMSVFTSFTTVMMPRMSSLIADGKDVEFKNMTAKSVDFLLLFCIPLIVLIEVFSPEVINLIAGPGYEGAILPMRILVPLMLLIGYEQIIIVQMLMPLGKDNAVLINSGVGAIVALILNMILVPLLASVGSSIVWFSCELAVAISAQFFVNKYIGYRIPIRRIGLALLAYVPALVVCIAFKQCISSTVLSLFLSVVFIGLYALFVELYITKNRVMIGSLKYIGERYRRY